MQKLPEHRYRHTRRNTQNTDYFNQMIDKSKSSNETTENHQFIKRKRMHLKTQSNMSDDQNRMKYYQFSPKNMQKKAKFKHLSTEQNEGYFSLKTKLGQLQNKLSEIKESLQKKSEESQHRNSNLTNNQQNYFRKCKQNKQVYPPSKAIKMKIAGANNNKKPLTLGTINGRSLVQSPKSSGNGNFISALVTQVQKLPNQQPVLSDSKSSKNTKKFVPRISSSVKTTKTEQLYYISPLIKSFFEPNSSQQENPYQQHFLSSHSFFQYVFSNQSSIHLSYPQSPQKIYMQPIRNKAGNNNQKGSKFSKNIDKTIIFDLDQTLIHCVQVLSLDNQSLIKQKQADICIKVDKIGSVLINIRPNLKQTLTQLNKNFELIVFTASHSTYANAVLDYIDPDNQYFDYRLFRQHCYKTPEGFYVKDLRIFDRPMNKMLLVDNAAYSYCLQPDNGVPILPYYNNKEDNELKSLQKYLNQFINQKDLRLKNRNLMRNFEYSKYQLPQAFIEKLCKTEKNL